MENVLISNERPEEIKSLVVFVRDNHLNDYTTLSEMRDKIEDQYAAEFSNLGVLDKKNLMRKLERFSFYTMQEEGMDHSMMNTLSRFRDEVLRVIKNGMEDETTYQLKRQVSPPLEAFTDVGHNKLNLKPTGRGFGLSFE